MKLKKMKILTISDHPLSTSGVGTQTRYMIEHLLKTGKYEIISLAGAVKHTDYRPQKTNEWGDDWSIYPVDGYGNQEILRAIIQKHKPDALWFMTDPRFYDWLWAMEDEIRANVPMIYHHVWDNYPYPIFNKTKYESNDVVVSISKVTYDIVNNVSPDVRSVYLPHSVDMDVFKKLPSNEVESFKKKVFASDKDERFLFFWNSRNARRKQTGSLVWWFKEFLDRVGHDKVRLLLHTDPKDPHGPDLDAMINDLGLTKGEIMFSTNKLPPKDLAMMYNAADCTLCISDAEGFGLSTLESLSCETPIVVTMTGGLQEQVTDGVDWFGIGIEPSSKAVIGSQEVPYIFEDRISKEAFITALENIYKLEKNKREELGARGREHLHKNYNPEILMKKWEQIFETTREELGSWETRKGYKRWHCKKMN